MLHPCLSGPIEPPRVRTLRKWIFFDTQCWYARFCQRFGVIISSHIKRGLYPFSLLELKRESDLTPPEIHLPLYNVPAFSTLLRVLRKSLRIDTTFHLGSTAPEALSSCDRVQFRARAVAITTPVRRCSFARTVGRALPEKNIWKDIYLDVSLSTPALTKMLSG